MTLNLKQEEPLLLSLCIRHVDVHLNDLLWALLLDEQRSFVPEHQRGRVADGIDCSLHTELVRRSFFFKLSNFNHPSHSQEM